MEFLNPKTATFAKDESGMLRVTLADGVRHDAVYCVPLFPVSDLTGFIAVMGRGDQGKDNEIGLIEDLKAFDKLQRQLIENDLKLAHFLPEITRINAIRKQLEVEEWDVQTDRGAKRFQVRNGRENTAITRDGVVIIVDEEGLRYRISDETALDHHSRAELEKVQV